jgi:putative oxidoreductase
MNAILGNFSSQIYAILRIVTGFMFMLHGTQKLLGFPPSGKPGGGTLAGLMLVGAVIELVGGFMIMVGFFSSIAAFVASGTMAVAYFGWHQPGGTLPIQNGGELAVVYCFVFLYIAAVGSGTWSVDALMRKSKPGDA